MKKIFLAIIVSIVLLNLAHFIIVPEFRAEENLAYAEGGFYLLMAYMSFIGYVVIGVPTTLIIDFIVKRTPKKKWYYDYLIQLLLFSIPVVVVPALALFVYPYFHLLFIFRLMNGGLKFKTN
ncbi:hypothetical protein [Bacillus sp. AFS041924]|uniref:hypothetical protein n=1 Tax=Bacillus sp. AFS041924 TaxID=2033503 RepID=UPI000BFBFF1D|nr:hypothetical protein [Bacillus sp. AFS041924]PGS54218.1 hypothetical protein COC46_05780 [Bacillus sp. AFS041924]